MPPGWPVSLPRKADRFGQGVRIGFRNDRRDEDDISPLVGEVNAGRFADGERRREADGGRTDRADRLSEPGNQLYQLTQSELKSIAKDDTRSETSGKFSDRLCIPLDAVDPGQTVQHLALDDRNPNQADRRNKIETSRRRRIAHDVRVRPFGETVLAVTLHVAEHGLEPERRHRTDSFP